MKWHSLHCRLWLALPGFLLLCTTATAMPKTKRWDVHEIMLPGPATGNPYVDVTLSAEFTQGTRHVKVSGFYDGSGIYRIRFSPDELGIWEFETQSNVADLNERRGSFECIAPAGNNHGPVRIVNTYYLEYADGTPFYSVGTTAYQWTSVKQTIQDQTVNTLAGAPFNKIRMCVFPKSYRYGNDTEPWQYPFVSSVDITKPNYDFFQNFDKRVRQLMELGIQADVILFHPYDRWGYLTMGKENNARYVRYMIARISAYRNVWWSLANEWDIPRIKDEIDWEQIGTILQNEDPQQHLRSIHNWSGSEDHFYDHTRPWITHVSMQTSQFYNAIKWRDRYRKPLLFDEMRYEGDVPSTWGNLTAEEMFSYFWMAGLSGSYGMHGDTFRNNADRETEVRWWAKGGLLVGRSPIRIAFFKIFMESLPVKDMVPSLADNGDPKDLAHDVFTFCRDGDVYVSYAQRENAVIRLNLTGNAPYELTVIDTWNMTKSSQGDVQPGPFSYTTRNRYEAICLRAKHR